MKNFNILIVATALFFVTGCVKPVQNTQPVYSDTTTQPAVYEETQPIIYEGSGNTVSSGNVITGTEIGEPITYPDPNAMGGTTTTPSYPDPYATGGATSTTSYPDPYATGGSTTPTTYPDPYATGGTTTSYPDPYASQPTISDYPSTPSAGQGGGIHLQIAALKNYYTAEEYKNRLSLPPGLSAYVQRSGAMNKVIVSGIPSVAEANRLKETRFPGAFIVQGGSSTGYTPPMQPNYGSTNSSPYTVDTPYGSSASTGSSGFGVQIGAFGSQGKAQSVANNQSARYPAIVKKIGQYYKVILTGFSSRSAARAHARNVNGFFVNY